MPALCRSINAIVDVVGFLKATCKLRIRDDVTLCFVVSSEITRPMFLSHPYDERGTSGVNLCNVTNGFIFEFSARGIWLGDSRFVHEKTCNETLGSVYPLAFGSAELRS